MNYGIHSQQQLEAIDAILAEDLVAAGVQCVLLIDTAGNTISKCSNPQCSIDVSALPAVAAGNFSTVESMAKMVGEPEFSLLYHKGEKMSIHFSRVNQDLLLINIFDNSFSLGLLRMKGCEVILKINKVCQPAMVGAFAGQAM